jgi:predicted Zn-ribbon and HTH transcriptional regulator
MQESEFQKHILAAFDGDDNVKMFRRNVGGLTDKNGQFIRFGQVGQSDLWGWIVEHRCPFCNRIQWGTHFEMEVKSDKGKATAAQLAWLKMVARNNGIAVLIHPERNDPIGLRERILKMLIGQKCPQCVSKSGFERKDLA